MADRLSNKYDRIYDQLTELFKKTDDPDARMATICALLYHKFDKNFWVGFYFLKNGELTVKCYQGPLACQVLAKDKGVCWAAINNGKTVIVPDVLLFPGHIACDSRSKSEIVVPVRDKNGAIAGVLDIDSDKLGSYCEEETSSLEKIVSIIFK
ncbi:MAG TPA: GAF domain-containing protein [bacterium]|nr:GAF domain-containing protein [bacterium]